MPALLIALLLVLPAAAQAGQGSQKVTYYCEQKSEGYTKANCLKQASTCLRKVRLEWGNQLDSYGKFTCKPTAGLGDWVAAKFAKRPLEVKYLPIVERIAVDLNRSPEDENNDPDGEEDNEDPETVKVDHYCEPDYFGTGYSKGECQKKMSDCVKALAQNHGGYILQPGKFTCQPSTGFLLRLRDGLQRAAEKKMPSKAVVFIPVIKNVQLSLEKVREPTRESAPSPRTEQRMSGGDNFTDQPDDGSPAED